MRYVFGLFVVQMFAGLAICQDGPASNWMIVRDSRYKTKAWTAIRLVSASHMELGAHDGASTFALYLEGMVPDTIVLTSSLTDKFAISSTPLVITEHDLNAPQLVLTRLVGLFYTRNPEVSLCLEIPVKNLASPQKTFHEEKPVVISIIPSRPGLLQEQCEVVQTYCKNLDLLIDRPSALSAKDSPKDKTSLVAFWKNMLAEFIHNPQVTYEVSLDVLFVTIPSSEDQSFISICESMLSGSRL